MQVFSRLSIVEVDNATAFFSLVTKERFTFISLDPAIGGPKRFSVGIKII